MKINLSLMSLVLLYTILSCTKSNSPLAPSDINDYKLVGKITLATGSFEGLVNYEFKTQFEKPKQFVTKDKSDQEETKGHYTYNKLSDTSAKLVLMPYQGSQELHVTLKFTSKNSGVYEAHLLKGGHGEQSGIFDLK